jgi:hypothetical protein
MNKKASFDVGAMLYYVMISIFTIVLTLFVYLFIINGFKHQIAFTPRGMESSILVTKALYSPDCFVYYDVETLRSYPGVIDINNFNQERFNLCFNTDKVVSLILKDENENIIKQINNEKISDSKISGNKKIFLYDKELKNAILEIRLKDDT